MKTILLWDQKFPDRRPRRLSVADAVAFALVRAGVAAAADPADAGALALGALALDPIAATPSVQIVLQHGSGSSTARVTVPVGAASIAVGAGVGAAVSVPVASVIVTPPPTPTLTLSGALAYAADAAAGVTVATIANVPAGVTPAISPADGRMVIGGDATAGWKVVKGMTASTAGTISITVSATGATSATQNVTVSAAAAVRWGIAGVGPEIGGLQTGMGQRNTGFQYFANQTCIATTAIVGTKLRLRFSNGYFPLGIFSPNTNPVNLEGADVVVGSVFDPVAKTWSGGTSYPIKFDGSTAYTFAAGEERWADDIEAPYTPFSMIRIRVAGNVAAGDRLPGHRYSLKPTIGEGVNDGGSSQLARLSTPTGTVSLGAGNFSGGAFTAVAAFFNVKTGGVIAFADSRFKAGEIAAMSTDRGAMGFIEKAYDSTTNGRVPVWLIGAPSSSFSTMRNGGNPGTPCVPWVVNLCAALGQRPFDNVDLHLGTNDLAGGGTESAFEIHFQGISNTLRAIEPARPLRITAGTMGPTTTQNASNAPGNFSATEEGQTAWVRATQGPDPSARSIVNARLLAGGFAAQGIDGFSNVALPAEGVDKAKIKSTGFVGQLAAAVATAGNLTSVVLTTQATVGELLLFEQDDATNFDVDNTYQIIDISGSAGSWTHTLARTIKKVHAVGAPVKTTNAFDSLHYHGKIHNQQAAILAAGKGALI